jgi:2'-5' RNA ligase
VTESTTSGVWISIRFGEITESKITQIRNILRKDAPSYYEPEEDPHLSVIPGATIPSSNYDPLETVLSETSLGSQSIQISNVGLFPRTAPYVIRLGVDLDLHNLRTELIDRIYELDGELLYPPVKPHITLYKSGNTPKEAVQSDGATTVNLHQIVQQLNDRPDITTEWETTEYSLQLELID